MSSNIALIGVENCSPGFDRLFSYAIPHSMEGILEPGMRVLVPFGAGNAKRQGFVYEIVAADENSAECSVLKEIDSVLDAVPLLNGELLKLARFIKDRCFGTWFACAKVLLPGGMCMKTEKLYSLSDDAFRSDSAAEGIQTLIVEYLAKRNVPVRESFLKKKFSDPAVTTELKKLVRRGICVETGDAFRKSGELSQTLISLNEEYNGVMSCSLTEKQQAVTALLSDGGAYTLKELCYYSGVGESVVKRLVQKGVLKTEDTALTRSVVELSDEKDYENYVRPVLSDKQLSVFKQLEQDLDCPGKTTLLYGITGSGKTNVYLSLIDKVLENGKNVIVLVPEISLTPQTFSVFRARYKKDIAILHSGLSAGERHDEWKRIKDGKVRVVIGTRSAVFAPLENIGLIVIDEEQEHTYKSESSPRYNAKDVARFRCSYSGGLLLLVSATPSVESYAKAESGKYGLAVLDERYGPAVLPEVRIIDLGDKSVSEPFMSVSKPLAGELEKNLNAGEQSILLVNRRGFNTFAVCSDCKKVFTCPRCSISLTYHSTNNRLMCHYCGYSEPYTEKCPSCGAENIRYGGTGTQKVEQELKLRFPSARILRMDADTTLAKNAHDKILSAFGAGEYDILLGTQMVAKGLDFPRVTLVGILSADKELYNSDFRCPERTFDLITQVVGRAGRGESHGRAVIQTLTPDNSVIKVASEQNYLKFYKNEIALRRALTYPPFCDIIELGFVSLSKEASEKCAASFLEKLKEKNADEYKDLKIIVLGPLPPRVSKVNNLYRQRLIIKCRNGERIRELIGGLMTQTAADRDFREVTVFADVNPENLN